MRGLILGFDGVLVHERPVRAEILQQILSDEGLEVSNEAIEAALEGPGSIEQRLGQVLEHADDPILAPRLAARFQAYYQMRLRQDGHRAVDGARELLEAVHDKGWMLAVVCASPAADVESALDLLGVKDLIKTVNAGGRATAETYQETWRRLNSLPPLPSRLLHPHEVLVLDADPAALEAAASAGLVTVGLTTRHPAAALTAVERTIDHPGELMLAAHH